MILIATAWGHSLRELITARPPLILRWPIPDCSSLNFKSLGAPVLSVPQFHTACCDAEYWMDDRAGWRLRLGMARRSVFDPLQPTSEPRWYVVRNMHRAVLEARALAPGANLKRALVAAMLEHIDAGWELGDFSSIGAVFFCTKGVERRQVEITRSDPGHPRRW
jgi:hypothetical protein